MRRHSAGALALAAVVSAVLAGPALAQAPGTLDSAATPRVIVLSDIGNEPDDQMSFTRFLLYANRMSVEGLVATTSTWQRDEVRPDIMNTVIDRYGEVQPNLLKHASGYRSAEQLRSLVRTGQPAYGMAAVGPDKMSPGAQQIIDAADRPDP